MQYGSERTIYPLDQNGSSMSDLKHFRNGGVDNAIRTYRIRVKVNNSKEEMAEYIRFTEELAKLRSEGKLCGDKEDPISLPSFVIQYPKVDRDGSYFVVKCYSILVDI